MRDIMKIVEDAHVGGPETMVQLEDGERTTLTLNALFAANDFSPEEIDEIMTSLTQTGKYVGGGGAAGEWSLTTLIAAEDGSGEIPYA